MATRVFSDEELARLRSFPEITDAELIRFFTLTPADVQFIDPGRGRSSPNRLGLAVQLGTLPWLGFVPDDVTAAPPAVVARLSQQLGIPVGELRHYGGRSHTRTDHLASVAKYWGWKSAKDIEYKELDEFLLARAMEHDSPRLLFTLACEHLKSSRVIRPGPVILLEHVAAAPAEADRETYQRFAPLLTPARCTEMDGMLHYDAAVRGTRLKWVTTAPEERLALLDQILPTIADVGIPDEEVGPILRGLGLERLRGALAAAAPRLPRDHGHLALMQESHTHLRQFTPAVLEAVDFVGGTGAVPLLEAVKILKELNAKKARKVPDGVPDDFIPARWRGYLADAVAAGDSIAYRHFWELTVLLGLRDGLRSGDVWVPGSRRYADPASYLFTPAQWQPRRNEFCHLVGKSPKAGESLLAAFDEHATAMDNLESVLAKSAGKTGQVRIDESGDLVIPPLTAEYVPAQVEELRSELISRLPFAPIACC